MLRAAIDGDHISIDELSLINFMMHKRQESRHMYVLNMIKYWEIATSLYTSYSPKLAFTLTLRPMAMISSLLEYKLSRCKSAISWNANDFPAQSILVDSPLRHVTEFQRPWRSFKRLDPLRPCLKILIYSHNELSGMSAIGAFRKREVAPFSRPPPYIVQMGFQYFLKVIHGICEAQSTKMRISSLVLVESPRHC